MLPASPLHAADPAAETLHLTSPAGQSVTLRQADRYQPADLRFRKDGRDIRVTVPSIDFLKPGQTEIVLTPGGQTLPREATVRALGRALRVELLADAPAVRLVLGAETGQRGELTLELRGVGRIVGGSEGHYAARRVDPAGGSFRFSADALACQNLQTQDGLLVVLEAGGTGESIRAEPLATGLRLSFPWHKKPDKATLTLRIEAFTGDATLALESITVPGREGIAPLEGLAPPPSIPPARPAAPSDAAPSDDEGTPSGEAPPAERPAGWSFFTGTERAFTPLLADPREATSRIGVMWNAKQSRADFDAALGGDLVMAEYNWENQQRLSISARGLFTARLDMEDSDFPLLNSDYVGGIAAGYHRGNDELELFAFHESSHLGDEVIEQGRRERRDYSREAIRLLWAHRFDDLRVYGGPTVNVRSFPSDIRGKLYLQLGAEYDFALWDVPMYLAGDLQSRQVNDWSLNFTGQYGVWLGSPESFANHPPRVFVEFFNGYSEMGQYYDVRDRYVLLGLGYNF